MKTIIHKANTRGYANHGWLDTHHTFSFANYYNPDRVHFGKLRVLNDDIIAGNMGFGLHPHDNMEIVSIPVYGSIKHSDSMGHEQIIGENEVQVMSAGTGIFHSEYNATGQPANFLQLWIYPKHKNILPVYNQYRFDPQEANDQWQLLVGAQGTTAPLTINQDAKISRIYLSKGNKIDYTLQKESYGSYLFMIDGEVEIDGAIVEKRDGIGITQTDTFKIKANQNSIIINIEV